MSVICTGGKHLHMFADCTDLLFAHVCYHVCYLHRFAICTWLILAHVAICKCLLFANVFDLHIFAICTGSALLDDFYLHSLYSTPTWQLFREWSVTFHFNIAYVTLYVMWYPSTVCVCVCVWVWVCVCVCVCVSVRTHISACVYMNVQMWRCVWGM